MKIESGLYIDNLFGVHSLKKPYSKNSINLESELSIKYDTIKNIDKYLVLYNNILSNYIHTERYINEYFGDESNNNNLHKIKNILYERSAAIINELHGFFTDSKHHELIQISHLQRVSLYYSMFGDPQGIRYAKEAYDLVKNEYSPTDFTYIISEFYLGKAYYYNYYYDDAAKYFTSVAEKLVNNIDLFSNTLPNNLINELYSLALNVFNYLFVTDTYNAYSYDLYSFINSRELRRKKISDKQFFRNSNLDYKLLFDSLNNIYKEISKCSYQHMG